MRLFNMAVAAGIGVISGQYIFKEPLEAYWAERRAEEAAAGGGGSSSSASTAAAAAPSSKSG